MRFPHLGRFLVSLLLLSMACNLPPSVVSKLVYNEPPGFGSETETPEVATPSWQPQPPPGIVPTDTPATDTSNQGHWVLNFLTDQTSTLAADNAWYKPVHGCWPPDYYDDGGGYLDFEGSFLEGHCAWKSPSPVNPQVTWNTTGTLTGLHDLVTGEVSFTLETQAEYFTHVIDIKYEASGEFTARGHAEGIASFSSTCFSEAPEPNCTHTVGMDVVREDSWQIDGSVPWTMDSQP
jgi:hypothetical protein